MKKTITDKALGRTLQSWRQQRGLSQKELRERLNAAGVTWSPTTLSQVEGGTRTIRFNEVPAIATVLDVSVEDLLPTRNLLASALTKARWTEKNAWDVLDDSRWKYEDLRKYRRALQMLHELGDGSESTYELEASSAHFLNSWLTVESLELRTDPEIACRAVGISDDEIETARDSATALVEDYKASGHEISTLADHMSTDNAFIFLDQAGSSDWEKWEEWDRGATWLKKQLFHENLGSLLATRFPNVIWRPAPHGFKSASDEIKGLVEDEP